MDTAEFIISELHEYNVAIREIRKLAYSTVINLVSGILINAYKSGKIIVQVQFNEDTRQDASALWNEVLPVDTIWQICTDGAMISIDSKRNCMISM